MKEKLTTELLRRELSKWPGMAADIMLNRIWPRIESDREAVREETREEMRRDHFKKGELVQFRHTNGNAWQRGTVCVCRTDADFKPIDNSEGMYEVRRPPKTRQMNGPELIIAIRNGTGLRQGGLIRLGMTSLLSMAHDLGIPTEVPDDN